jgi:hypothetical protein
MLKPVSRGRLELIFAKPSEMSWTIGLAAIDQLLVELGISRHKSKCTCSKLSS